MRTAEKTIKKFDRKQKNTKHFFRMHNDIVFCDLRTKHRDEKPKQKQIYLHKYKPGLL